MNGNSNVLLQNNDFLGYDPEPMRPRLRDGYRCGRLLFRYSPFLEGISDGGGNQFVKNEADPNGSCPE